MRAHPLWPSISYETNVESSKYRADNEHFFLCLSFFMFLFCFVPTQFSET